MNVTLWVIYVPSMGTTAPPSVCSCLWDIGKGKEPLFFISRRQVEERLDWLNTGDRLGYPVRININTETGDVSICEES